MEPFSLIFSKLYRGYLLFWGEYQIYFIENSEKISIFHECVARVKMLIFSPHEMKYIWYLPKKSKFSFYFILNGNTEITTLLFTWLFLLRFGFCSVFIGYNIGCKHSLHLENGLESYFNGWNARNQHLKKDSWVCLRVSVTCKLALRQVKQWRHYVWCWRHNMRSVIFDKYTSLKTLCWKIPVTKLPRKPCFATVLVFVRLFFLLYVPSQQLWSLRDGKCT